MNNTIFPIYRISTSTKAVVKFISPNWGYVIDPGSSGFKTGSCHSDWIDCYENCWEPYDYVDTTTSTTDHLKLFETVRLTGVSSSTLTKVPNGYVMTSHSGHQLFIKDISKESL